MAISAATYEYLTTHLLPKDHQEVDIIWHAKSPHQSMIDVLVKTDMFVIWGQTVYVVLWNKNDIVN